ncbi:MAG: alpha-amylase family glycosyl hydrolase [Candidatus Saccharibacteria bacterium]|nr:alpha-amylase family glycosyl hydrolase [Candidatus Saccharibacteria bacterium]
MSWLDGAVIYQIFTDRFAGFNNTSEWRKPVYVGGNIRGIIDKFSYIRNLGVNTIWITPFNTGVSYHGYHITDFFGVDSRFGDEKDIENLINIAHSHNIKIICDFVPNHCSNMHPFFIDAQNNKDSEYRKWFIFDNWPDKYKCFRSYKELPKLNLDNVHVRTHLINAALKWLGMGFDGFRIDHVVGVSNDNLRKILEPLRKEFPEAVFIGEAWFKNNTLKELASVNVPHKYIIHLFNLTTMLYKNYAYILDGILDFSTATYFEKYALSGDKKYCRKITSKQRKLNKLIKPVTFLDNHDMERFLFRCGGNINKLKLAANLQFSMNCPTVIYSGTEIGMSQTIPFSAFKSHADIMAREPMEWDESKQNAQLYKYYQELIKRKLIRQGK